MRADGCSISPAAPAPSMNTFLLSADTELKTIQPPGWNCDISGVRRYEDLPKEARDYVETVEKAIGCHISYVSVGAEREAIITR